MRQAVILAGGRGTRLEAAFGNRPKSLVPIDGIPLLERQVDMLRGQGFDDVVLLVGHRSDEVAAYCRERGNFSVRVRLLHDGAPRGTAGAVLAALDHLDEEFIVVYGDTLFDIDLERFSSFHAAVRDSGATLFLHPNDHPHDSDLVELDERGFVTAFHPCPHVPGAFLQNLVNAALYAVRRPALMPWRNEPSPLDFGQDLFPRMLRAGVKLRGYVSPEYIKDVGTIDRLDRASVAVATGVVQRSSLRRRQRAVFIDRDGTLNAYREYVRKPDELEVYDFAGPAVRRLNQSECRVVVVTNQPVLARGECTEADLRAIHGKLDMALARDHAYIDRYYVCPHHPHRGYPGEVPELKVECACRKPGAGLLARAARELNLDLHSSWLVGDSTADAGAAHAAGVPCIWVETGEAGLDARYPYEADFVQRDLACAVAFILDGYPRLARIAAPLIEQLSPGDDWFIGGLSRSGKTSLAGTLRREARRKGLACEVVSLDRWLLGSAAGASDVYGRFDVPAIEAVVRSASGRRQGAVDLTLPSYDRRKRARTGLELPLILEPGAVVIWEGVVANAIAEAVGARRRTVALTCDEAARRERVLDFYQLRGHARSSAERVYADRERDEHALVRRSIESSAMFVDLSQVFRDGP